MIECVSSKIWSWSIVRYQDTLLQTVTILLCPDILPGSGNYFGRILLLLRQNNVGFNCSFLKIVPYSFVIIKVYLQTSLTTAGKSSSAKVRCVTLVHFGARQYKTGREIAQDLIPQALINQFAIIEMLL